MTWLGKGEKFALIAMNVQTTPGLQMSLMGIEAQFQSDLGVQMPDHWREWLGSMRADELEECNLFIVAKSNHSPAGVLDGENQELYRQVWNTYIGLMVELPFSPSDAPIHLSGGRPADEIDVREQSKLEVPPPGLITGYPQIEASHLRSALIMGDALTRLRDNQKTGRNWRLVRTLTVFVRACTTRDMLDRIHQFCRCIEGLILPREGETKKQFKSRTELFIGPSHHDLIGAIYDVRSAVEHLREDKYVHGFDRDRMLSLVRYEAILAHLARSCLKRILTTPSILPHFANVNALEAFWELAPDERRAIWGAPVDPLEALANYRPDDFSDADLGANA